MNFNAELEGARNRGLLNVIYLRKAAYQKSYITTLHFQ